MPTYRFRDKKTDEIFEKFMSISERDVYVKENEHLEQVPNAGFAFVDSVKLGRTKPSEGFRDMLRQIKRNNRGSKINTFS